MGKELETSSRDNMNNFKEFVDKKGRRAKYELDVLKKVLVHNGLSVQDNTQG